MDEVHIGNRDLHHYLRQRSQPTLQCVDTPPVTSGHCSSSPDHDAELTDAAKDVDRAEAVFQGEGDEHGCAEGESRTADGEGVV